MSTSELNNEDYSLFVTKLENGKNKDGPCDDDPHE